MKRRIKKLLTLALSVSMLASMIAPAHVAVAAEGTTDSEGAPLIISEEDGIIVDEYNTIDEYYGKEAPQKEGYVFAGWYTDKEAEKVPYIREESETLNTYYAKFVPEAVLGVKAQNRIDLLNRRLENSDEGQIRFVTSVDSLNYKEVGFHVEGQIGAVTLNKDYSTTTVYRQLYVVGSTDAPEEEIFASDVFNNGTSKWFVAQTFKIRLDQFGDDFTITPYWITFDGVRVEGVQRTRSMLDNLEQMSEANIDQAGYYEKLEDAVGAVKEKEQVTLTVTKDKIELESQMEISGGKDISIRPKAGMSATIYRKAIAKANTDLKRAVFLIGTESDETDKLTIGTGITIDGRTLNGADEGNEIPIEDNIQSYFYNYGTFTLEDGATIQYVCNSSGSGGALNNKGTAKLNGAFKHNKTQNKGGAVYSAGTIITEGCVFEDNYTVTATGGAIYSNGNMTILESTFMGNSAKTNGGAIFNSGTLVIRNSEFRDNTGSNGGALQHQGPSAKFYDTSFKSNTANNRSGAIDINIKDADAEFYGCTFEENVAKTTGSYGSALYANQELDIKFAGCTFKNNYSYNWGGAIAFNQTTTRVVFEQYNGKNSVFENNYSKKSAGNKYGETSKLAVYEKAFTYTAADKQTYQYCSHIVSQSEITGTEFIEVKWPQTNE